MYFLLFILGGGIGTGTNLLNLLRLNDITFETLDLGIAKFDKQARDWTKMLDTTDLSNPIALRMANDQMMQVEKIFLTPVGLPMQNMSQHVILRFNSASKYGKATFPGITKLMESIMEIIMSTTSTIEDRNQWPEWEMLRRHVTEIYVMIIQATSLLKPVYMI
jgi:hypothetical protein